MLDIVMIDHEYMHMFAKCLAQLLRELCGRRYVSMVLRYCLPVDALYTLGDVVDRRCDTPVESFVEQVEPGCEVRQALFLIFLSNVSYA
jgi:hypothetical protein